MSRDGNAGCSLPEPYRRHLVGFVESLDATMYEIQRLAADEARLDPCHGTGLDVPSPVNRAMLQRVAELRTLTADLRDALGLTSHQRSGLYYLRAVVAIAVEEAEASLAANNMLASEIAPTHRGALEGTLHEIRDLLASMQALLRGADARP
ncbi:MAG TPA: hypothetical protein VFS33_02715 [Gemmatimonadales bacterium]|nr:hypothetical protein [Gemmatimonadales bacterium]